ncbi:carboxypeptidase-like regulatory domain-containing protein [Flavobacterium sp.]|uniref:carboxypeptidase-like regulatory domain-containing protein n=1 Tax=Flavobacterium sp. TaxID=239 RepID=UPI0026374D0E|nr:carboxypeptidase-like regulatory domain-containing protein [Flavobacterium sp.]
MKKIKTFSLALLMFISYQVFGQERIITGTVSDKIERLPFVTINIKGTQKTVNSDIDGKFSIKAKKGDKLIFSFLGYDNYEQEIGEKVSDYQIILKSNVVLLEETYGYDPKVKKKNLPSTTTISVEELKKPVEENSLENETSKNEPVYIVNGIISTKKIISEINPDNIESIKIIKGEDSSKIYGQEYKNGVLLITTKKLSKKQLKKLKKRSKEE